MKPLRHPGYLQWIRTLPCSVCRTSRAVEAAHTGPHGLSQKSSDLCAIPLVRKAPPYRGRLISQARASEVLRGSPLEYRGDRRAFECEAVDSRSIGHLRGPVP